MITLIWTPLIGIFLERWVLNLSVNKSSKKREIKFFTKKWMKEMNISMGNKVKISLLLILITSTFIKSLQRSNQVSLTSWYLITPKKYALVTKPLRKIRIRFNSKNCQLDIAKRSYFWLNTSCPIDKRINLLFLTFFVNLFCFNKIW